MLADINFNKYYERLSQASLTKDIGKVLQVRGSLISGVIPGACMGSICEVYSLYGDKKYLVEVVGFENKNTLMMPLTEVGGIGLGSKIILRRVKAKIPVGEELLGRIINGLGEPIDGLGSLDAVHDKNLYDPPINPLDRKPIREPLCTGVKSIDSMITVGRGQRVGILAGSGVGKSYLMGMMAENSSADVNVIALIGERGREVKEFVEERLGEEGLKKSVIIVATSDQSPLVRVRGAFAAMAISEYFASQSKNVLLMMDSVTRFSMAQREIGLNIGEPPTTKGYTPSVFSLMPKLLERAGSFESNGSITGLFTVLVEGDDLDDPIADTVRSIVDGHIVLDRKLAERGHFPAVDVLKSSSRLMLNVTDKEHQMLAKKVRELLSVYAEAEDLINIGAYQQGANAKIDQAIYFHDQLVQFLQQSQEESFTMADTIGILNNMNLLETHGV